MMSYEIRNQSKIILIGIISIIFFQSLITTDYKGLSYSSFIPLASSQQSSIHVSNNSSEKHLKNDVVAQVQAHGHFANDQIKNGIVNWIQGGLWNLEIKNVSNSDKNMSKPNMSAIFNTNFTMIKPDGSLSHSHLIDNFSSNNVIFVGNDIIVIGTADIHSTNGVDYKHVPITVHLMGKKVLGLIIDVNKTNGHFASSNEMYGTLIGGIGLDSSENNNLSNDNSNNSIRSNNASDMRYMMDMKH